MSFITSLFGGGSGAQKAEIQSPVTTAQANNSYQQVQDAINMQKQFAQSAGVGGGQALGSQQQLLQQLGLQAQGQGPNPALMQLQNATGQNVANQAALMASQRGTGANAGLLARQAAMQGGNIQQQAAGQGALMQAQQQLAAQQALQNQQAQMVSQQFNSLGQLGNTSLQGQQNLLGSIANQNNANVSAQNSMNTVNGAMALQNNKFQQGLVGGALGGLGSALSLAHGGAVSHMADGGSVNGPSSFFGKFMQGMNNTMTQDNPVQSAMTIFGGALGRQMNPLVRQDANPMGSSDLSNPQQYGQMAYSGGLIDYTNGGKLPGKAEVSGDSLKNDKVPIMGSPGEIMLPRSITMHPDAPEKARDFVAAIMAKHKMGKKK